jgi:hypothetical protein
MNWGQLKKWMERIGATDTTLVILSKDAEGNAFRELHEVSGIGVYDTDTLDYMDEADNPNGKTEVPAACLWPHH